MSCPDCFSGTSHTGTPIGSFQTIHGIRAYVTSPFQNPPSTASSSPATSSPQTSSSSSPTPTSSSTIILITDAFGLNLPNTLLLADTYASKTGFRVLVPDIIPGGGVPLHTLSFTNLVRSPTPSACYDIPAKIAWAWNLVRLLSIVIPFSIRSRNVFPVLLIWVRSLRAEMDSQVEEGGGKAKLGLAGFCWGGLQTTKLCSEPSISGGNTKLIDFHFTAHPISLSPSLVISSITKFSVPLSLAIGEQDAYLTPKGVDEIEATLRTALGDEQEEGLWEIRRYKDCGHGFAVRADKEREEENEAAGQACEQAVETFRRWLA